MRLPLLLCALMMPLGSQEPMGEDQVIAAGRKAGSKPRPIAPRGPLSPEERNVVRRFKEAKASVVHIGTAVLGVDRRTRETLRVAGGLGTGFVWDDLGHVVTNNHVISAARRDDPTAMVDEVQVKLASGKAYKARVIGRSLAHDIAVLRVFAPLKELKALPLGRSGDLQTGQTVLAIGNPLGLDHSLSTGVVSALDRTITTDYGTPVPGMIQTDAAINPGNSGGPLLDSAGRLIGMNTAVSRSVATGATEYSGQAAVAVTNPGIGFAIPVDNLNRVVPRLIARGGFERPRLGFTSATREDTLQLGIDQGILVVEVVAGSPAAQAGLRGTEVDLAQRRITRMGDIIVACNGREVANELELMDLLTLEPIGRRITFTVLREGTRVEVVLELESGPKV